MKRSTFFVFLCLVPFALFAQSGREVFSFLDLPSSSQANTFGYNSVSLIDINPALGFENPALPGQESGYNLSLDYMNYISGIHRGSAAFALPFKERGTWMIGAQYLNYGTINGFDEHNQSIGSISAQDIALQAAFSYDLSDRWRGGAALLGLFSSMDQYNSFGIAVNTGVSYYNSEKGFSLGVTLKGFGSQLTSYNGERQRLPWNLMLGIGKKLQKYPLTLYFALHHLNTWKVKTDLDSEISTAQNLFNHTSFAVEIKPSEQIWLGIGYDPKITYELKGGRLNGFSFGGGIQIQRFAVTASVKNYHPSAMSFMIGLRTTFKSL